MQNKDQASIQTSSGIPKVAAAADEVKQLAERLMKLDTEGRQQVLASIGVNQGCGWLYAYQIPFSIKCGVELDVKAAADTQDWVVVKIGHTGALCKRLWGTVQKYPARMRPKVLQSAADDHAYATKLQENNTDHNKHLMFVARSDVGCENALRVAAGFPIGKCLKVAQWNKLLDLNEKSATGPTEFVLCRRSTFENIKAKFHAGSLPQLAPFLWETVREAADWKSMNQVKIPRSGLVRALTTGTIVLECDRALQPKKRQEIYWYRDSIAKTQLTIVAQMHQYGVKDPLELKDLQDCLKTLSK
eukprot:m.257421 g.257421  ORF g.257421 m.257421 type:complete len:302 (-) comp24955_c0_seq1:265-1170(-)